MADDLELLVRSIEGEGPSPDFVATLRQRVVAETETPAVLADDEPVVEIDLRPQAEERTMTRTRWMLVGLAAAAIALIVGFVALSGDGDEGGIETIDVPEDSSTSIPPTTTTTVPPGPSEDELLQIGSAGLDPTRGDWSTELFAADVRFGGELASIGIRDAQRFQVWRALIVSNPSHVGPDCVTVAFEADLLEASCVEQYETLDNLAIRADALHTLTSTVLVGPDGIQRVAQTTELPAGADDVGPAFEQWLSFYHRGESLYDAVFAASTVDELQQAQAVLEERIAEWSDFNDEFGCTLDNWIVCGPAGVAGSLLRHWQSHEVEELLALFDDDSAFGGEQVRSLDEVAGRIEFERSIGLILLAPACAPDSEFSGAGPLGISCFGSFTTASARALGVGPYEATLFSLSIGDDNVIEEFERSPEPETYVAEVHDVFVEWLETTHPTDVARMIDADGRPITDPEAIELWAAYTEEFVAAQG